MSDEPRNPQLENLLSLVVDLVMTQLRTSQPARVVSYDASKQTASIQPLIQLAHIDESQKRVSKAHPEMHDVPVWFLGGSSGRITVPVKVGDLGHVIWTSASIARWKVSTGSKTVDPGIDVANPEDAIFLPGGHAATPPTTAPTDAICLHGPSKIGGPTGTQKTLMANSFLSALDTLISAIGTAVGGMGAGGPAAGTAIGTALTAFQNAALRAGYKTSETEVK